MKAKFFLSCMALAILFSACNTTNRTPKQKIEQQIDSLLKDKKATVGVAVLANDETVAVYNNQIHFPLLSVFKYHVGLAVLDKMDKGHIALDSLIEVKSSQLKSNTYSPLRDKFPDQDITISLGELLKYSISQSDNNACDILIEYAGGIDQVNEYVKSLRIKDCNLGRNRRPHAYLRRFLSELEYSGRSSQITEYSRQATPIWNSIQRLPSSNHAGNFYRQR